LDVPGNEPLFPASTANGIVEDPLFGIGPKFYRVRVFAP